MKKFFMILVMCMAVLFMAPNPANAQIMNIDLNDLGNACTANAAPDNLFQSRSGENIADKRGICTSGTISFGSNTISVGESVFGRFFCLMETTMGLIISKTFCAIRDAWLAPFGAMMLLLMVVTGAGFITGILQFTVKEISAIIFKMGLVTLFVMNADVAMDLAYGLYIGLMKSSVQMLMGGFNTLADTNIGNTQVLPVFAKTGTALVDQMKEAVGSGNPFNEVDTMKKTIIENMKGNVGQCSVFSFILFMLFSIPFISGFVLFAAISFFAFFARAAYGYIYALVMVTFLISAMPIFVSFALFKSTNDLFEHWIKYIGSNVIQIAIVFAIMGFATMIDINAFLLQLDELIVQYPFQPLSGYGIQSWTLNLCSICEKPNFQYHATLPGVPLLPTNGDPICLPHTNRPYLTFTELIKHEDFLKFFFINGAALYILTVTMEQFMKQGPTIAQLLGGARLVQSITGQAQAGIASTSNALFRGSARFEQGVKNAWRDDPKDDGSLQRGNSISKTGRALREGAGDAMGDDFRGEDYSYRNDSAYQKEAESQRRAMEAAQRHQRIVAYEYNKGNARIEEVREAADKVAREQRGWAEFEQGYFSRSNPDGRPSMEYSKIFRNNEDNHSSKIFDEFKDKGE